MEDFNLRLGRLFGLATLANRRENHTCIESVRLTRVCGSGGAVGESLQAIFSHCIMVKCFRFLQCCKTVDCI